MFYLISNPYGFTSCFPRCFSSWLFWCLLQNFGFPIVLKCMSWFLKTNGVYLRFLFNVSLTESSRFVSIFFMSWCDSAEVSVLIYFCYATRWIRVAQCKETHLTNISAISDVDKLNLDRFGELIKKKTTLGFVI